MRVTLVQPGFIRSDSFEHVRRPGSALGLEPPPESGSYVAYYRHMAPFIARLMRRAR